MGQGKFAAELMDLANFPQNMAVAYCKIRMNEMKDWPRQRYPRTMVLYPISLYPT